VGHKIPCFVRMAGPCWCNCMRGCFTASVILSALRSADALDLRLPRPIVAVFCQDMALKDSDLKSLGRTVLPFRGYVDIGSR